MNPFLHEIWTVFRLALGNPQSDLQLGIVAALGFVALVFGLDKLADLLGAHQTSRLRAALVLIISIAAMLAAVAAVNIYGPKASNHDVSKYLPIGVAVVVVLVIATPAMMLILKTSYMSGLFSFLLAAALGAVIMALASAGFSAAKAGGKDLEKQKERKDNINKMME